MATEIVVHGKELLSLPRHWHKKPRDVLPGVCTCSNCRSTYDYREAPDYIFRLFVLGTGHMIDAGCREMTIAEYRDHVNSEYPNTDKARATLSILNRFERALAKHLRAQCSIGGWHASANACQEIVAVQT